MSAEASLSDAAYAAIRNLIVTGQLRGGAMLSETELCTRLDTGRTPVRVALQRLELEGFVEIHPRRGALVTTFDIHKQLALLELRRPLEALMVKLAATRATPEERTEMLALADSLEQAVNAGDRNRYIGINEQTHDIEARAAKNVMLQKSIGHVHLLSRWFWYSFITSDESFSIAAAHHCAVLRAIAAGQPELATEKADELLNLLERVTREAIERSFSGR